MRQHVKYHGGTIYWYFNGNFHRERDLPSYYSFMNGKLSYIVYYHHGMFHRTTGPVYINYDIKTKLYYYQDKQYASLEEMQMVEACK